MRGLILSLNVLLVASCVAPAKSREDLSKQIESQIVLPKGARPMNQYSRNYAFRPDGKVVAVYVHPYLWDLPVAIHNDCFVEAKNSNGQACTEHETMKTNHQLATATSWFGAAGQSRWFSDYRALPSISDGGCDQINIVYDPLTETFESANCNGLV